MPTLFTKIINREIPSDIVYEDEFVVGFRDLNPQAPTHILIVPRHEIPGLSALPGQGDHMHILNAAGKIAEKEGLKGGYRLVINQGDDTVVRRQQPFLTPSSVTVILAHDSLL